MTESKKNLVENIKNIKKGIPYGLSIPGFSSLSGSNLSGLLKAITQKEELKAFHDFVGEYIQPKELEILLRKNITTPEKETKNALSFLPEGFINKINKDVFLNISNECLGLITPEQFNLLPEEIFMQLTRANRLQYLSNECLDSITPEQWSILPKETFMQLAKVDKLQYLSDKSLEVVTKDLDLYHKYETNIASKRLTENELKTQLTSLIEAKKLGYLAKEAISKITDGVITSFGDDFAKQLPAETIDYLATVNGDGIVLMSKKICVLNINSLPVDEFKKLKSETIAALSSEQIGSLDKSHLLVLKENPLWINSLGKNFSTIKDIDGININSLSEIMLRYVTNEQLEQFGFEQFKSLCNANKSQCLNPQIIKQIPDEYLLYLAEHGLTKEQTEYIDEEQFKLIKNNIKPEIISAVKADIIAKDQEFLKNLTIEQAEQLTVKQAKAIQKNNMLNVLPNEILFFVTNKIKNSLSELDEDTLNKVAKSRNKDIPILDSKPKLTDFDITINSDGVKNFNKENIGATIDARIEDENWAKLKDDCFCWIKNNEQKSIVYQMLNEKINSRASTVYGFVDKIQLLLIAIPLAPNNEQSEANYQNMERTVVSLINEPSYTVDEYLTKSDLYSSIVNNSNLSAEFREMICQEQIKLMEKDFVDKFYTKSGRNSLYNDIREEISKAYLNYANLLTEKYKEPVLDISKFEKELTPDEERELTLQERKYYNCIKKMYEYTPDLESKVRYWTATGTRLVAKTVATYFVARAAVNSSSKVVSAVAGAGAAAGGISTVSDASNVVEQFFTLNNREDTHKNERNEKLGIFKRLKRSLSRIGNRIMIFLKIKENNKFSIKNLSEPLKKRTKAYRTKTVDEQKQRRLMTLGKEIEDKENSMLVDLRKGKDESRQSQLIEDNIEIRTEALKLLAQKKAMALKEKYPEFQEKEGISGIFSRLANIGKSILNGVVSGILDTASLGYGGDAYKRLVDGKSGEEKVRIESRLMAFQKGVSEIDEWLVGELNNLRKEECHRLASMNEDDKQKLNNFRENINQKKEEINQEMEIFNPKEHIKLDKSGLLPSLVDTESLDLSKLNSINESLEVLIDDNHISTEMKVKNIESINKILENNFNSGNLDLRNSKITQNISETLDVMNKFITAQLSMTFASFTTNEMDKQKQELEKEQTRINDIRTRIQEKNISQLNIGNPGISIQA